MEERAAGILLHPTSLPGAWGIGDLGPGADRFLDWAAAAGASWWQILPLGPPGHNETPYTCYSAFAGNEMLISPDRLREGGLLAASDLAGAPAFPDDRVDFAGVSAFKGHLLRRAWERFRARPAAAAAAMEAFAADPAHAVWLEDWVLYRALKDRFGGAPWPSWPAELRRRDPEALAAARRELAAEIDFRRFLQFVFNSQWRRLKAEAHRRGVRIFGDMPIYVALDSADVWARPHLFDLDAEGRPLSVAGVPPDYFSATGQLWGNPLYRWDRMEAEGYAWWIARIHEALREVDLLRIDHFRGLAGYWEIPAGETTAVNGAWREGPGLRFFEAVRRELGDLPLVAEDLGFITQDVRDLLAALRLPGMKVLHFAFADEASDHLPGRFAPRNVVYTGTHDNDTTRGWFAALEDEVRRRVLAFTGTSGEEIHWDLIGAALRSEAILSIAPLQDLLGLGSEARMNDPRRPEGNWGWRVREDRLTGEIAGRFRDLAGEALRVPSAGAPRAVSLARPGVS